MYMYLYIYLNRKRADGKRGDDKRADGKRSDDVDNFSEERRMIDIICIQITCTSC